MEIGLSPPKQYNASVKYKYFFSTLVIAMKWMYVIGFAIGTYSFNFSKAQSILVNCTVKTISQNDTLILKSAQQAAFTFMNARFGPQCKGVKITISTAASEYVNLYVYLNRHAYTHIVPKSSDILTDDSGTCIVKHDGKVNKVMYTELFDYLHAQIKR